MSKAGDQPERIAVKLRISPEDVEKSIRDFEATRALLSPEIRDMATTYEYLSGLAGAGQRIQEAQRATRFTGAYDAEGNPVFAPDHQTAMEAIKTVRELGELTVPKGGNVNVAVGINNNANSNGANQGRSFEAMLREAEKKYQLEAGHPGTIDAEIVDEEATPDVALDDPDSVDDDDDEGVAAD
jgi:hypothetical protein